MNEIRSYIITNGCIRQDYVQGFEFEAVTFKQAINIFKHMELAKMFYKGVLESSYKTKTTSSESTHSSHSSKMRGEYALKKSNQ